MEFLQACGLRRSIRWFKVWEPVPKEKIQRILQVVRWGLSCPSNLQPWRAIVVEKDRLDPQTRETLLACNNWQGAHVQAPVWIYWYCDPSSTRPDSFRNHLLELIDAGALPSAHGWSKQALDAAIEKGEQVPIGMPGLHELLHELPEEISQLVAYSETVGACDVACLAAVNEGLGTCLNMIAIPSRQEEVKQILGVPNHWVPVWLQLVGYPAEDPEGGGQRPRLPFEELFFAMNGKTPLQEDPEVREQLKQEGLIREPAPKAHRFEELKYLSRMFGYPI